MPAIVNTFVTDPKECVMTVTTNNQNRHDVHGLCESEAFNITKSNTIDLPPVGPKGASEAT